MTNTLITQNIASKAVQRLLKLASASAGAGGAAGIAALALVAAQPALADEQGDEANTEMTKGEERLAKLLEGRVAGEPQNCIRSRFNDQLTVIDETAYVYGRGNTIYVQRTTDPEDIDSHDVLVSRRFDAGQICRQDVVTTVDRFQGFFSGAVFFADFIPYTRVDESEDG